MNTVERIKQLCKQRGIPISKLEKDLGFANGYIGQLRKGVLRSDRLNVIAEYLQVSSNYLMGNEKEQKKTPVLTAKDERDIARDLERFIAEMDQSGDLMFDGDPMTPEAKESIVAAMKLGLEAAKMKNKDRFTPKKYREKD